MVKNKIFCQKSKLLLRMKNIYNTKLFLTQISFVFVRVKNLRVKNFRVKIVELKFSC